MLPNGLIVLLLIVVAGIAGYCMRDCRLAYRSSTRFGWALAWFGFMLCATAALLQQIRAWPDGQWWGALTALVVMMILGIVVRNGEYPHSKRDIARRVVHVVREHSLYDPSIPANQVLKNFYRYCADRDGRENDDDPPTPITLEHCRRFLDELVRAKGGVDWVEI
jgi:hypothetical protein